MAGLRDTVLAVALGGLLVGCGAEGPRGITRLIETRDAEPFARDAVSASVDVTAEVAAELGRPAAWRVVGEALERTRPDGSIELESPGGDLGLEWSQALPARDVDVVEVVMTGLQPAALPELRWRVRGAGFCDECRVRLMWRDGEGARRDRFRFEVGAQPSWNGVVEQLQIRPTNLRNNRIRLERVTLYRRRLDEDRVSALRARTVLFAAADEYRPAVLLEHGRPLATRATIARGDRLRFGLARPEGARQSLAVRVEARQEGQGTVELGRVRLPQEGAGSGWLDCDLPLDGFSPGEVELSLALEGGAELDDLRELVFLGTPEIVHRRPPEKRLNILLISIDTLRADRLSLYGYGRPTTPRLSAWVDRTSAVVFEKAVTAAASTLPSHASMFSGLEVLHHGAYLSYALSPRVDVLAEILAGAGYRTLAVTGGGFVHPRFGLAQGFDRFHAWPRGQVDGGDELGEGVKRAGRWLAEAGPEPFLLFFHTYEVHSPYRARQPQFSQWSQASPSLVVQPWLRKEREEDGYLSHDQWPRVWGDGEPRDLRADERQVVDALYDSGVARVDGAIDELLQALASAGHADDTIVVFTSDHGEALGERDFFSHGFLYDHNLLVPLVVRDPRRQGGALRVGRQVREIDILPTLLDLAGLPPRAGVDGVSLAGWIREGRGPAGLEAWSYAPETNHGLSLRKDRVKLILRDAVLQPLVEDSREVYALDVDPREERNLASQRVAESDAFASAAFARLGEARDGVSIEWRNASEASVSGVLAWDGMRRHNSKLQSPTSASFRMRQPGRLEFALPPRSSARTRFMTPAEPFRFRLEIEGKRGHEWSGEIPVTRLCEGPVELAKAVTAPASVGWPQGLEILVREAGGCSGERRSDRIEDTELAAGLRALGYLH